MVSSPVKVTTAKLSGWWVVGGIAAGAFVLWSYFRRKAGESLFGSVGRGIGESAAGAVTGALGGVVSGIEGATNKALDWLGVPEMPSQTPGEEWNLPTQGGANFTSEVREGFAPLAMLTNLQGVQGLLTQHGPGDFEYLVQATLGDIDKVAITLRRDGPGLTPQTFPVTTVQLPAGFQVTGRGKIPAGGQVRLYSTPGGLLDKLV